MLLIFSIQHVGYILSPNGQYNISTEHTAVVFVSGFSQSSSELKSLCLEFMEPWLFNLPSFLKHADMPTIQKVFYFHSYSLCCASSLLALLYFKILAIIQRLIKLTVEEKDFYPSVQTKIWGSIGQMPDLIDMVLDAFIETSASGGLGSKEVSVLLSLNGNWSKNEQN